MTYAAADLERIFAEHLRAISATLSALGAEYMLIGGLAVGVWAEPRATRDADLSVRLRGVGEGLSEALGHAGFGVERGDLARAVAHGESVRLRRAASPEQPIVVDLLFAITPFEIEALARRTLVNVFGIDMPVATPEDLFVFKLIAGRPQDFADAAALHDLHGERFDGARVRRWCREFGVEERLAAFGDWAG
jgi:hypothetical protein